MNILYIFARQTTARSIQRTKYSKFIVMKRWNKTVTKSETSFLSHVHKSANIREHYLAIMFERKMTEICAVNARSSNYSWFPILA